MFGYDFSMDLPWSRKQKKTKKKNDLQKREFSSKGWKLSCLCARGLHGPDFSGPAYWKNYLSSARPAWPVGKVTFHLPARPGTLVKSPLICRPSPGLGSGPGSCISLSQPFVRSCAWKIKTIILLFTAKTFLHIWMIHVNFILFSSTQTY